MFCAIIGESARVNAVVANLVCAIVNCFCFVFVEGLRWTAGGAPLFRASLAFIFLMDTHNDGDFVCTTDAWAHFSVVYLLLLRFQNGGHCRQKLKPKSL